VAGGQGHTVALTSDGAVRAWGDNSQGQLGSCVTGASAFPGRVVTADGAGFLTGVVSVAAGWVHSVALKSDGAVWAWGRNEYGALGDGTTAARSAAVQVKGPSGAGFLTGVASVTAGARIRRP